MAKHVMMSQPPGSGLGGGPSIGNYKGVMLCNRPFAGVQAAAAAAANSSSAKGRSAAFKAGIPDGRDTLGLNPTKKLLPHAKPKKRITAVGRHKKWLRELQEQKRVLEDDILEEESAKEKRRKAFSDRERQKRQLVNAGKTHEGSNAQRSAEGKYTDKDDGRRVASETKLLDETDTELDRLISEKQEGKVRKRNKPAWAYTEASKKKEDDEMEDEELQELLDFTNNLDFEEFIEDVEVKQALEQLRHRVEMLTPRDGEDQKGRMQRALAVARTEVGGKDLLKKAGIKVLRPLTEEALDQLQQAMNHAGNDGAFERDADAQSVMSEMSILSDTKSLRSVHSTRSIAAIRRRFDRGGKKGGMGAIREASLVELPSCPEPIIITESAVMKMKNRFEASRLPYIHRNPAV